MSKDDSLEAGDALLASSLGTAVTKHREAASLGMAELARAAGMSRAYLWRIEQGRVLPGLRNLARLAVALDLPIARLMDHVDVSGITLANRGYDETRDH